MYTQEQIIVFNKDECPAFLYFYALGFLNFKNDIKNKDRFQTWVM